MFTKGLKFRKFDLHIHSPASDDFKDKTTTPEDIVTQAIAKGLAGIAITDHQTGTWVDRIKLAAGSKDLAVFPGVELKVHGGKDGIHILVLFDVDKSSKHVAAFLNTLKVYEHRGAPRSVNKTVVDVAKELQEFDPEAILVLAHCLSTQGVVGDMRGGQRSEIFKPEWISLIGAESTEADFLNPEKIKNRSRVVDFFDGKHEPYHFKKLGVYQASDAHELSRIGEKFTYFKVDDHITIEDIRQCLIDRETRIRQSFEYRETTYQKINGIKITSGFLEDQELEFHEGLNSILGAKGSGKSLAIEFLRFALNQQPKDEELFFDHNSKLEKCLKLHGEAIVSFTDESGKRYQIKRTYNPAENFPIEIVDLSDGSKKDFQIEQIFPVLFLSQNEIIKIAEDKTGASQREFIDKFFDFYKYQQEIEKLKKDLAEVDYRFVDSLKAHLAASDLQKKISTRKEEILKIARQLEDPIFTKYSKKEKIGQAIKTQIEFNDSLKESLLNTEIEYKDLMSPSVDEDDVETAADPAVKRAIGITDEAIKEIKNAFSGSIRLLDQKAKALNQEYVNWKNGFESIKVEYEKIVKDAGGNLRSLDQRRKILVVELGSMEKEMAKYKGKAQQMKAISEKRNEVIDKLDGAYRAYFDERKKRCDYFTSQSGGALSVTIKEREDKTGFRENLLKIKRGSWLKDEDIEAISQSISPREFIDNLFRYEWWGRAKKDSLQDIETKTKIRIENIEKLAQHLLDEYDYKDILALLYTSVPKDVPLICYRVGTDFKKLDELSIGQKAVALLIISLSEGAFPIIIDQPEDSLDLRSIWEDVCQKLRGSKDRRQFIFTTHNASVAVASDSDKFTILQADANQSKVIYSGSINRSDIKKEVIDYLEGGTDTYSKKRAKYNIR